MSEFRDMAQETLERFIEAVGLDFFHPIRLTSNEEFFIQSKGGDGFECRGNGTLYLLFIPDEGEVNEPFMCTAWEGPDKKRPVVVDLKEPGELD